MNYIIGGSMLAFVVFVTFCFGIIFAVISYRGFLGMTLWKWTRIPFAYTGSILLSIGMNGVPALPREEEYDQPKDEIENLQAPDERGKVDDATSRRRWVLLGETPQDVQQKCVSQAYGSHAPDEECEGWDFEGDPKEPMIDFKNRRAMERAS